MIKTLLISLVAATTVLITGGCNLRKTDADREWTRFRNETVTGAEVAELEAASDSAQRASKKLLASLIVSMKEAEDLQRGYSGMANKIDDEQAGPVKATSAGLYEEIKGRWEPNAEDLDATMSQLVRITEELSVGNCNALQKQIIEAEKEAYRERHNGRDPRGKEWEAIMERAGLHFIRTQKKMLVECLRANERLQILWRRQRSILFEYRVVDATVWCNRQLKLNAQVLFETGFADLSTPEQNFLAGTVADVGDTLSDRLNRSYRVLNPDLVGVMAVTLHVDAFADTQRIAGLALADAQDANKQLSQERAEAMLAVVQDILLQRLKGLDLGRLSVTFEGRAQGFGEQLPRYAEDAAPDGADDPERRIADIYLTIALDEKAKDGPADPKNELPTVGRDGLDRVGGMR